MKKALLLMAFILLGIDMSGQDHSVAVKLLSSEPSRVYANVYHAYPSSYEYDDDNRVRRVFQTNKYGGQIEIAVDYGINEIVVTISENSIEVDKWVMTLENGRVIKDERFRDRSTTVDEIYTYTYDGNGKITHIDREVPVETDRNMSYELKWEHGLLVQCNASWNSGKTAEISYTYTDIEDNTLANFYVSPFSCGINNYKVEEYGIMELLDCQGFYGWQLTRLPESITETSNGKQSKQTFTYTLDNEGRVSNFIHNYYGEDVETTLIWGERVTAIESQEMVVSNPKSAVYDLKGIPVSTSKSVIISNRKKTIAK